MRLLFTICGRAGSKGIKNKNLRDFVGKPLMYYSISAIDLFLKRTELAVEADIVINFSGILPIGQSLVAAVDSNHGGCCDRNIFCRPCCLRRTRLIVCRGRHRCCAFLACYVAYNRTIHRVVAFSAWCCYMAAFVCVISARYRAR